MQSFERLVYRYETRIFGFLRQRLGNAEDAEDVTQQVFVKAFRGLARFDASRRFAPWLYTIARRQAATHYRSQRREPVIVAGEADHNSPAAILEDRESETNLWQWARRQLSADQFMAMWLRIQEDFSVREIARTMGKTQTSVKVLLHRGRRRLADAWPTGRQDSRLSAEAVPRLGWMAKRAQT